LPAGTSIADRHPILLLVHALGPGGTERQVAEIAKNLNPERFQVHVGAVLATGMRATELAQAGIPLLELPVRSLYGPSTLRSLRLLRSYLKTHRIQVVHTFDPGFNVFAAPAARYSGVPVVLTSQRCYRELIRPKYHPMLRFSHRIADAVVANCEAMRSHLQSDYGVPDRKIRVLYNGLDTSVFHAAGRERLPALQNDALVIGSVGLLRPEKCLNLLVDAFAEVRRRNPALKLVLVGSGEELPRLRGQAADLGLGDACLFEPASADVVPWLRSIDVFVLPSRSEALSNSLLEAMACGCCPVASRVGGNPELVIPGETGLLFESGDAGGLARALETLIRNPDLRLRLAAQAQAASARFSVEAAAQRAEQIYLEFCSRLRPMNTRLEFK
jgi:glycosyltransferase involved in cell wall biosynthesis